jgi:hypothetical protein
MAASPNRCSTGCLRQLGILIDGDERFDARFEFGERGFTFLGVGAAPFADLSTHRRGLQRVHGVGSLPARARAPGREQPRDGSALACSTRRGQPLRRITRSALISGFAE